MGADHTVWEARRAVGFGIRSIAVVATLAAMLMATATTTRAEDTWCDIDPAAVIVTPGGTPVVVYVSNRGPIQDVAQLTSPTVTYTTNSVQAGTVTRVHLQLVVADPLGQQFPVISEVWTGPSRTGTLLSTDSGVAGRPLRHQFTLNVP